MRDHPHELEADLLQYFGVDLLDYWRRKLSFRRLCVLVLRLLAMPGQSSLAEAKWGEQARWGYREHLLADIVDRLNVANWLTAEVNRASGSTNAFPEPHPRPGAPQARQGREQVSPEFAEAHEVAEFFSRLAT
ncbi:hypothetical protein [Nonomuraea zeae]|uniref:hypothetical protein n=1 Tax=Nonomuraea zeae TaxID=1642303 RepID=UPI003607436F